MNILKQLARVRANHDVLYYSMRNTALKLDMGYEAIQIPSY